MAKWLTQEWLDDSKRLAESQPERPGATARMQYVITGAPDGGTVEYYWVLENGKLLEAEMGRLDDPNITLSLSYEDAKKVQTGELDENTAFMQGRIKVEGDMAKLMSLMPITNSPEYRQLQDEIRAVTQF